MIRLCLFSIYLLLINNACGSNSNFSSDSFIPTEEKNVESENATSADPEEAPAPEEKVQVEPIPVLAPLEEPELQVEEEISEPEQEEMNEELEAKEEPSDPQEAEQDEIMADSFLFEESKAFHLGNGKIGSTSAFNTDCEDPQQLLSLPLAGRSLSLQVTIPEGAAWEKLGISSICGLDRSAALEIRDADGLAVLSEDLAKKQSSFEADGLGLAAGVYTVHIDPGRVFFDADDILIDDIQIYYKSANEEKVEITPIQ